MGKYHKGIRIEGADEFLLAVNITGHGAPTEDTEAEPGMCYLDEDSEHGDLYKCIGVLVTETRTVYRWKKLAGQEEVDQLSEAIGDKLDKSGGTLGGKFVIPTADTKAGFVNSEDMKIFGYGTNNFRMGDPNKPLELRGSGTNPMFGSKKILVEGDITGGLLSVETITIGDGDSGETETIPVTGLSLDLTTYSAKAGDGFYINPVILPTTATNKAVTWKSSATNTATVDGSGYVDCIAEGNAVITCTTVDGGFTATCAVTITAADGGDNEEGGETTGQKIQFSTLERTSGGIKADGTAHTLGGTYYVEIPYTDGMVIRTLWNGGWSAATYPPILVKTGDVYTPHSVEYVLKDNGNKESMSVGGKHPNLVESTTLTGYGDGSTVIVGMLIGDADESKMDSTDYLYYIPGGEA